MFKDRIPANAQQAVAALRNAAMLERNHHEITYEHGVEIINFICAWGDRLADALEVHDSGDVHDLSGLAARLRASISDGWSGDASAADANVAEEAAAMLVKCRTFISKLRADKAVNA